MCYNLSIKNNIFMALRIKLTRKQIETIKKSRNYPVLVLTTDQDNQIIKDIEEIEEEILNS